MIAMMLFLSNVYLALGGQWVVGRIAGGRGEPLYLLGLSLTHHVIDR